MKVGFTIFFSYLINTCSALTVARQASRSREDPVPVMAGYWACFQSLWQEGVGRLVAVYVISLFGFAIWVAS